MHTLTTTAQFPDQASADEAIARVLALKHSERSMLVGGAAHVEVDDTGHPATGPDGEVTVVVSVRVSADADDEAAQDVSGDVAAALAGGKTKGVRGGGIKVRRGELDLVEEKYVDDSGQVQTRQANRVVHGETGETLRSEVRILTAIDEDGTPVQKVAVRSLVGEDGRKVVFPQGEATDDKGRQADVQVTVDEVTVNGNTGR